MNRKIVLSVGEFYHIYNRGVEKKDIFLDKDDYERFISLLFLANGVSPVEVRNLKKSVKKLDQGGTLVQKMYCINKDESLVGIGAYCLMPNHFHILINEKTEGGITKFMHKLTTAYTMYFNKKYERVGPLLQGTFKSEHADSDEYLKYLFSYIHLNPLKIIDKNWKESPDSDFERRKTFLEEYLYSSYLDYYGFDRGEKVILDKTSFPEYFVSEKDFKDDLLSWLSLDQGGTLV